MKIYVKNNDISRALRVLKKKMTEEGDLREIRERQHFVSKSEQNRIDAKAGRKRWLKKRVKIEENRVKAEQAAFNKNRKKRQDAQRNKQVA
jgi:ribosomal protein S21